jgi:serine/threonine-protein kinase
VLAEVLALVHARGLVHGGVSPANLMAAGSVVKVSDLGLGRVFQTVTGAREYWPNGGRFDAATDLYAMAATLYHLLTGVNPRTRPELKPPSALSPGIPPTFDALLVRALDPRPEHRFSSAHLFLDALAKVGGRPA